MLHHVYHYFPQTLYYQIVFYKSIKNIERILIEEII